MITLFTDFGLRDSYVAQLKGAILGINPHVPLLDLTHHVTPFNIREASYVLDLSSRYLPAGTIVVAVVDPGVGTARRPLLVVTGAGKFYVGPDNGLFTDVLAREGYQAAYVLQNPQYFLSGVSTTFHGRDIFGPVAAHLARGVAPQAFGPRLATVTTLALTPPQIHGQTLLGELVHIDHYGNMVSNIPASFLTAFSPGQQVAFELNGVTYTAPFLTTYGEAVPGQLLCLVNSNAVFEIAVAQGQAAQRLAARVGDRLVLCRAPSEAPASQQ